METAHHIEPLMAVFISEHMFSPSIYPGAVLDIKIALPFISPPHYSSENISLTGLCVLKGGGVMIVIGGVYI